MNHTYRKSMMGAKWRRLGIHPGWEYDGNWHKWVQDKAQEGLLDSGDLVFITSNESGAGYMYRVVKETPLPPPEPIIRVERIE